MAPAALAAWAAAGRLIAAAVERNLADYISLFQRLLRVPTPRNREHAALTVVADSLRGNGVEVSTFDGQPADTADEPGPNLFATIPAAGRGSGRSLLLEAHIDTVPPGQEEGWRHGPWSGATEGTRLYGRGAHDDRGGVALLCMLAHLLREIGAELCADLYLLVTSQEEYDCGGMRAFLEQPFFVRPDGALLVDGTGTDDCIHAHPACLTAVARFPGPWTTAQGASADDNPIVAMGRFVECLPALAEETWASVGRDDRRHALAAATAVRSRGWMSNLPEWCEVELFANLPAGATFESWRVACEAAANPGTGPSAEVTLGALQIPAFETSLDSPLLACLRQSREAGFGDGRELRPRRIGGWGDIGLLGAADALFYGPGAGGGAHGYDEYYDLDSLAPMLRTLAHLALQWCGTEERM